MPIYENQLSYSDMKKAMGNFVCGEGGLPLNLAWSAERNCYMLRCGRSLGGKGETLWKVPNSYLAVSKPAVGFSPTMIALPCNLATKLPVNIKYRPSLPRGSIQEVREGSDDKR